MVAGMEGRKKGGIGSGMSAGSKACRQGEGMRDEGEQGMDGWSGGMGREQGGDAGVFPGTAFYCTHSIHPTTHGPGRCTEPHIRSETHTQAHTKKHFVIVRAFTVSGEQRCGRICISGYYTL